MKQQLVWLFPHLEQDGGGTKFLLEVAKRLSKTYDLIILCNTASPEILQSFQSHKLRVKTVSFLSANSNLYWLFLPLFLLYDFLAYKKIAQKADMLLSTMYPSNFLAYCLAKTLGKQHFHYCYEPFPYLHDAHFISEQRGIKKLLMQIFAFMYAWTDTLAIKKAQSVFTLNDITQRLIQKVYSRDAIVTRMGVDTKHFRQYKYNPIAKKYADKLILTHATDYSDMKRTDLAIKAIKALCRTYPNILLVITSTHPDSPNKKIYEQMVQQHQLEQYIFFANYLPYAILPKYYAASRCYLSCSFDEMLGTTSSNLPVKEALACGVPAIRAPITNEDVIDGISGFLVDPRQTKKVVEKVKILLENKAKAEKMGKNGREMIKATYSWDRVAKVIEEHLAATP